jgi:hypothetical protein
MAFLPPFATLPAPTCDDRAAVVMHGTGNQQGTEEHRRLSAYKLVADELLPFMRSRGHLHHLIFRDRTVASAVVVVKDGGGGELVLGGATFRLLLMEGDMAAPVHAQVRASRRPLPVISAAEAVAAPRYPHP